MADEVEPSEVAHRAVVDAILEAFDPEAIDDLDVTVTFVDEELTIDVYLHVPGEDTADVVNRAIERGTDAVDALYED